MGLRDICALRALLLDRCGMQGWQLYQRALLRLKRWTKSRHIDSNALGYFGGFTWSLLLADTMLHGFPGTRSQRRGSEPLEIEEELVTATCKRFASWPWPKPVSLSQSRVGAPCQRGDLMPIHCTTEPYANSARNITTSTQAVLLLEMEKRVTGETKPVSLYSCHSVVRCQVTASEPAQASCATHWLEARLLVLVKKLDHVNARPLCLAPGLFVVGTSAEFAAVEQAANEFQEFLVQDDRDGDGWSDSIEIAVYGQSTHERDSLNRCVQA